MKEVRIQYEIARQYAGMQRWRRTYQVGPAPTHQASQVSLGSHPMNQAHPLFARY